MMNDYLPYGVAIKVSMRNKERFRSQKAVAKPVL